MKLSISLLLPLVGAACAADTAKVFILSGNERNVVDSPTLSSVEAGLVLAQRLGVSQYHKLHEASRNAVKYINDFGLVQRPLFADITDPPPQQLVIVAEGWTSSLQKEFDDSFKSLKPSFQIAAPPSESANEKFVKDITAQISSVKPRACGLVDAINPYSSCWNGPQKVLHLDFKDSNLQADFLQLKSTIQEYISSEALELTLIAMPESSRKSRSESSPYGSYDMPSKSVSRRSAVEEPITDFEQFEQPQISKSGDSIVNSLASNSTPIRGIVPFCHASLDACISATNNCSNHGSCFQKYASDHSTCYTCGCIPDFHKDNNGSRTIYWGGAACQKEDISAQFWLIATFVIVLAGLISWAIGMMFSIGEEKLPGVIGAGVSGPKAGRS